MKLIIRVSLVFFTAAILNGCLQVETTLFVKKDGSGTIEEKVLMSRTFADMLKEFAQSFQDSASSEEFTLFKDDEIISGAQSFGKDVNYLSHEFISDENWEGYSAVYSFDDVGKITLRPDPDDKVDAGVDVGETGKEEDYFYFRFIKGDAPELIIDRPEIELKVSETEETGKEDTLGTDDKAGEEFMKMMEGMKVKVAVNVEGEIVSTNAKFVEGSVVTLLQLDFGEVLKSKEDFREFQSRKPQSIEEMNELLGKFPGMKLEIQKPVTIKFK